METSGKAGAGTPFGRYILQELMARGGMGEVFRATALGAGGFERPVVIKRILPQLKGWAQLATMFVEEARMMSRLLHPNIVQVLDFGQGQKEDYFLVMELVEGVDVGALGQSYRLRDEAVPPPLALFVTQQILRGLHYAHTRAYEDGRVLVHRDVSPGNVLLSRVGEVKVADFGVASVTAAGEASRPGGVVGKPSYMAPEQFRGESIDARADLFAVGVVLFQLLTGTMPFAGADGEERQKEAVGGRLRDARALRDGISSQLAAVLARALAPEADERFGSAREMSKAIAALTYPVATSDDLAEVVERLYGEASAAKPVIALGDGHGRSQVRELTRTGPGGEFTMQVARGDITEHSMLRTALDDIADRDTKVGAPHVSEPAEAPVPKTDQDAATPGQVGRWLVLVLLLVGAVTAWISYGADPETRPAALAPSVGAKTEPPAASGPPTASATAPAPPAPVPSASSSARPTRVQPTPPSPPNSVVAPPPSPPPPDCVGSVRLSTAPGAGTFFVDGPTGRVQAPGLEHNWPCGSYGLTGTSRVDNSIVISRSVTIRKGETANVLFR